MMIEHSSCTTVLLLLLLLLLLSYTTSITLAEIVGAAVMPHGGIALAPSYFNTSDKTAKYEADQLHKSCEQVGVWLGELHPDLVLLSTPHGIADLNLFQFYLSSHGSGWADTDNCDCPPCCYNVSVDMNDDKSKQIITQLQSLGSNNVSGIVGFGNAAPFPLRWGEVIPLHFIIPHLPSHSQLMVISQPNRRYNDSVAMIPELTSLGNHLYQLLQPLKERVVVVVSADLAHTHLSSGPYGYSNASQPFDDAVGKWAKSVDQDALLVTAASLVDRALSCGFTGLVMLDGLMHSGHCIWSSHLYANYHPSYYGMMVASFQ